MTSRLWNAKRLRWFTLGLSTATLAVWLYANRLKP